MARSSTTIAKGQKAPADTNQPDATDTQENSAAEAEAKKEDAKVASEREDRSIDTRDSRHGSENRNTAESRVKGRMEDELVVVHKPHTDGYPNHYDSIKDKNNKYRLGWFPQGSPILPGWKYVPYSCLDDEVRGHYDSMRKGQLGDVVIHGNEILQAQSMEDYQKGIDEAVESASVNMERAMIAAPSSSSLAKITDMDSGKETVKLDG